MRRKKCIGVLSCFIAAVCFGTLVVQAAAETSVTNQIETGVIDIELKEYQKDADGDIQPYEDNPVVLPGTHVSKIPRITNEGYDCYVRAKLKFDIPYLDNSFKEFGSGWYLAEDGYYYCKHILKHGESTDIFQGIAIPEDFPQKLEDSVFHLDITTDAIQSKNFEPDWDSKNPWGMVEIQECKENGPYEINTLMQTDALQVIYEGNVKELFAYPDDFFVNFPTVMPGDTYEEVAQLKNHGNNSVKLYFEQRTNLESHILGHIKLNIYLDDEQLFAGTMGEAIAKRQICELKPNEEKLLKFDITVPKELDNDYTLDKDEIKWIFSCDELSKTPLVQTGDMGQKGLLLAVIFFAGFGMMMIRDSKKEDRKNA